MPTTDPKVDAYVARAAPFARPMLEEVRARVHAAVPGLTETIKWNAPFFLLNGRIFVSMAAFKAHAKLLLWKSDFRSAMPETIQFTSMDELPGKAELAKMLKASAATFGDALVGKAKAKSAPTRASVKASAKRRRTKG